MSAPEASSGRIARETERLKMALDAADSVVIGAGRDLTSGGCIIRRGTMGFSRARFAAECNGNDGDTDSQNACGRALR